MTFTLIWKMRRAGGLLKFCDLLDFRKGAKDENITLSPYELFDIEKLLPTAVAENRDIPRVKPSRILKQKRKTLSLLTIEDAVL